MEEREAQLLGDQAKSNPHGFVYEADLNTYRMNKAEKKEAMAKEKETRPKNEYLSNARKRRDKKSHGSTNVEKLKNKPMNMLLPKKAQTRNEARDGKMYVKRKSDMKQLGHFKKNQQQKIESKKRKRIK